jgi:hypothetical protein
MSMTRAAQRDLWRSVLTGDRSLATEAEIALSLTTPSEEKNDDAYGQTDRRVPVRVFVRTGKDATERHASWRDVVWTSAPVPVYSYSNGSRKSTTRDALALVAPRFLEDQSNDSLNDGEIWRCFVQGVDVRLDAPLDALHARMRGADRFLHVCAVRLRAET